MKCIEAGIVDQIFYFKSRTNLDDLYLPFLNGHCYNRVSSKRTLQNVTVLYSSIDRIIIAILLLTLVIIMYLKYCVVLLSIIISINSWAENQGTQAIDQRISLGLTETEKIEFLSEMRQMLASIQGIISGIGENNPEKIIKSARYSGNRMARATPKSVKSKIPKSFQEIGGPTLMMFEELVIRAETDDMETLTLFTGEILQQCTACHEMFKVD